MTEKNGRPVAVGDKAIAGSQLVEFTAYDEAANLMSYKFLDGGGMNIVTAHISNTPFELLDTALNTHLAEVEEKLEANKDVLTIAAPTDPNGGTNIGGTAGGTDGAVASEAAAADGEAAEGASFSE